MPHIVIISSSVRIKRNSHRVALFFRNYIEENQYSTTEILDLNEFQFPVFNERLRLQLNPSLQTLEFAEKIKAASGVILITPEYNGGYPAALKNAIDLLYDEWHRKPVALVTVSSGPFGGSQVLASLQFTLWKMRAWVVPAMFPVPLIESSFNEFGVPADKAATDKRARSFIQELLWCIAAKEKMKPE